PYGHQKFRTVGALASAALVLFAGVEILQAATTRLIAGPAAPGLGIGSLVLLLVSLALQAVLAAGGPGRRASGRAGPLALSTLVLASLGLPALNRIGWIDTALAVAIALLLLRQGWQLLRRNLPQLVDQIAIAPEAIHAVAMAIPGVLNCHDIASRGVIGQLVFIDMHMVVEAEDLPTAHRITELVEEHLEARFGPVRCTIHMEPREYASSQITFRGTHG
ncbi:cation diffusion facilitator family transporter, partial [Aphanothece microscopica]